MLVTDINIQSVLNFRPLGANIKTLNKGLLYRSADPSSITNEDCRILYIAGIRKYFDLRSTEEIQKTGIPKTLINNGIEWCHVPISGYHEKFSKIKFPTEQDYAYYYLDILRYGNKSINKILKSIAYDDSSLAYGCTAGKDRTGVVSALILSSLNIKKELLVEDYSITSKYLLPYIDKIEKQWDKIGNNRLDLVNRLDTKSKTMYLFLDLIEENYGTVFNYLYEFAELEEKDIYLMKEKLLKGRIDII